MDEVDGVGEEGGKKIVLEDSKSCIKKVKVANDNSHLASKSDR